MKEIILVVDDSDVMRSSLKTYFEECNYKVITCMNGLEGIQRAIEHKPVLIFLDIMMPNFDGLKMLQVIRLMEEFKEVPIIVMSANTNKKNVFAAIEGGANRVMSKPLQKETMVKYVKELLGDESLRKKEKTEENELEESSIRKHLIKFFLHSFPLKKSVILEAFESQNKNLLRTVFHELKGSGGTIGYQNITDLSSEIEDELKSKVVNWEVIRTKAEKLFSIVVDMQKKSLEVTI